MGEILTKLTRLVLAVTVLGALTAAQSVPTQSVVSSPALTPSTPVAKPTVTTTDSDNVMDPASLLPDLPVLPHTKATLVGGTIERLDRVRDQLIVEPFGGGKMKIAFDPRTHVYNDGSEAPLSALHRGARVYIDTMLDGSTVFARNIRLRTATAAGESQGTVVSYNGSELTLRDALSPDPLKIRVTDQTRVTQADHAVAASELIPGTLVAVNFGSQARSDVAEAIAVLAVPGTNFTFVGQIAAIDFRLGLLVLSSSVDHKTYEVSFDPSLIPQAENLQSNEDVTVLAEFDGSRYVARKVFVNSQNQR